MSNHYKPNIMVVGPSGTGKSTSYEKLPKDDRTIIIDTELKGRPFREDFPRVIEVENCPAFHTAIDTALTDAKAEYIIVDSLTKHLENAMNFCRAAFKGYDIWSNYSTQIRGAVNKFKSKTKTIIVLSQDELGDIIGQDGNKVSKRVAATLGGKEWDSKLEKEFLVVMFTDVRKNPDFKVGDTNGQPMLYRFLTNNDGICTAKSPAGMFDKLYIPNDLLAVTTRINEYYKK